MLASGAHVKIGSYEFLLDETIDAGSSVGGLYRPHYRHNYQSLFVPKSQFAGGSMPKDNLRPQRLTWYWDDFSGGENARVWYKNDPTVYNYSYGGNPRIRGQLTGRPSRTVTEVAPATDANGDVRKRGKLALSQGKLWVLQARDNVNYSSDGTTYTAVSQANIGLNALNSGYYITAVAGNNDKVYYSAWYDDASTNGKRVTMSMVAGSAAVSEQDAQTNSAPFAGMCIMGGMMYCWTGRKLWRHDITQTFPLGGDGGANVKKMMDTGVDPPTSNVFGGSWWADCVAAENSVFAFYSTGAQSRVYEFRQSGGWNEIWTAPYGYTIKSMCYQNGLLYMAGHWGGDSATGWGGLYVMPLDTRRAIPVGFFRRQTRANLQMQECCMSYGNQVIVTGCKTGRVFIYDADTDGITALDVMATSGPSEAAGETSMPQEPATDALSFISEDHRIGDTLTWGNTRYFVVHRPQSASAADSTLGSRHSVQVVAYADDEPYNRQGSTSTGNAQSDFYTGTWDFDIPFAQKTLMGFDVVYDPLTTGQSISIYYSLDQGNYTLAETVDYNNTDASKGRHYIDLSGTNIPFTTMSIQIVVKGTRTGGTNYLPPILRRLCAEAQLIQYDESWDLILRLKHPNENTRKGKAATTDYADKARDYILNIVETRQAVTFIDGYRYRQAGKTKTYTVTIEQPEDIIFRNSEGAMKVTLAKVPD